MILLLILLLIPSICFGDSESTIGGKTAQAHIIQSQGTSLRPRPYLDFEGGITCDDVNGHTVCTGGSNIDITTSNFVTGSQTISGGKLLLEDSTNILLENGTYLLRDYSSILDFILLESGAKLLLEDSSKILNEDSIPIILGAATALFNTATLSSSVWATANNSNSDTLYIGGSSVSSTNGIPLSIGEQNVYLPTVDLSKVYITGNAGDGISFIYFGSSILNNVTYLGNNLTYLGNNITYLGN